MGLYEYETKLAYGVIETDPKGKVKKWSEKPSIKANINMGCYVMEPGIFEYIPKGKPYGMDDVIKKSNEIKKEYRQFYDKKRIYRHWRQRFVSPSKSDVCSKTRKDLALADLLIRKLKRDDLENGFLKSLDSLRQALK